MKKDLVKTEMDVEITTEKIRLLKEKLSFDDFLSNKIGFGRYQYFAMLLMSLVTLTDGAEVMVISFLIPVLENEWNLTLEQQSMISSSFFLGFFFGSVVSGQLGDRLGRRIPLLVAVLFNFSFGIISSFSVNVLMLIIFRGLFGIVIGIIIPLSYSYLSEILPKEIRGRCLVLTGTFFTAGSLLTCLVAYLTLDSIDHGDWRGVTLWSSFPGMITFLLCAFFMHESPRYLLLSGQKEKFLKVLNVMIRRNKVNTEITAKELKKLYIWVDEQKKEEDNEFGSPLQLFKQNRKFVTPFLWTIWFVLSACSYGIIYILPEILKKINAEVATEDKKDDFVNIALSCLFEIPSGIISIILIEKQLFGRKNLITFSLLLSSVFSFMSYFIWHGKNLFILFTSCSRFFLSISFLVVVPFTLEIYPTKVRVTGIGIASSFSRIGGICMSWIVNASFSLGKTGPFMSFGIMACIAAFASFMIPYDTTGVELDEVSIKKMKQDK